MTQSASNPVGAIDAAAVAAAYNTWCGNLSVAPNGDTAGVLATLTLEGVVGLLAALHTKDEADIADRVLASDLLINGDPSGALLVGYDSSADAGDATEGIGTVQEAIKALADAVFGVMNP